MNLRSLRVSPRQRTGRRMEFLRGAATTLPLLLIMTLTLVLPLGLIQGVWIWPAAWTFLGVMGVWTSCWVGWLAVARPTSFAVRRQGLVAKSEKKQPLIDALGVCFYAAWMLGWFIAIPLDVFRFRLLPPPPMIVQGLGALMTLGGIAIAYSAVAQNRFAAPTIHDQSGEGQVVIQTGLYAIVRHPFYAGGAIVYPGTALWLGSYAAAIASISFLLLTLARIVIEERYLRENLSGYDEYAQRVRSRLIPGLL